ncbi:related to Probable phosphatase PSR2 [Nakaseomyces glabratus]|nr:FCP1 homology domain profile [Nakaseomyces glabratus]QNG12906.1 uncharacterized protein GWK60_D03399 [Nakaseomyces glabratus]SCV13430.1 related to Probable phosphatase PSR2 [Nakaseomyces glabratus]SLM11479.1 related to Probable phosphatase PSR2 [Nakaseomyces glabratus]
MGFISALFCCSSNSTTDSITTKQITSQNINRDTSNTDPEKYHQNVKMMTYNNTTTLTPERDSSLNKHNNSSSPQIADINASKRPRTTPDISANPQNNNIPQVNVPDDALSRSSSDSGQQRILKGSWTIGGEDEKMDDHTHLKIHGDEDMGEMSNEKTTINESNSELDRSTQSSSEMTYQPTDNQGGIITSVYDNDVDMDRDVTPPYDEPYVDLAALQEDQYHAPGYNTLLPPQTEQFKGKKCLVLDLDETLVHSSFKYLRTADFVLPVNIDDQVHNVYVIKRPGVDEFLKRVGELYEVVVFTASVARYGDPLLDILDQHKSIHHRLFREACYSYEGNYIKNLSQIGRPLSEIIILDNSPASYIFHPQHAIPVSSWFSDSHDNELIDIVPLLEDLSSNSVLDVGKVLDVTI